MAHLSPNRALLDTGRDTRRSSRLIPAHTCIPPLAALVLLGCGSRTGLDGPTLTTDDAATPQVDAAPAQPPTVLLFGGLGIATDGGDGYDDDTWQWTTTGGWTELQPARSPPAGFGSMAATLDGTLVLFGGVASTAQTWTWDGTNWTQQQPSFSPPTLISSVLVPLGRSLVLFAGYNNGIIYDDVWTWDGSNWTHESPAVTPQAREAPAGAVLDGKLVIFGGEDDQLEPMGDTWVFDGKSWTQMQPAHSPSARRGAVAATLGNTVVLFGGDTIPPAYGDWLSVDETWTWDGHDWTQQQPAQSPDPRSFAAMATAGDQVVLFGGGQFGGNFGQPDGTWTWDGSSWTRYSGPSPSPRNYPAMASK